MADADRMKRYSDYNAYLRSLFGERVQKISVDAGLTCPNRDGTLSRSGCIYCNAKGSGTGAFARGLSVSQQIEAGKIGAMKKYKARKFLAYFQSFTNTYAPVDHLKALYDEALSCDGVVGMAVGTRPDCVDKEKIDLLDAYTKDYLVWLEYGLQSAHDATLALINRGHDFKAFEAAVALAAPKKKAQCLCPYYSGPARRNQGHDAGKCKYSWGIRGKRRQNSLALCGPGDSPG